MMKKHVAGLGEVEMSADEAAAWLAESEANDPANLPPPVVSDAMISDERERRIAMPLTVQTSAGRLLINMDTRAQRNLQGLASVGTFLKITAQTTATEFRDFNDVLHMLTPDDLIGIGLQVAQRIHAVYSQSWALKAKTPIPDDFADDRYWP